MKVLITDKINESAGDLIKGVAEVDFLPTMSEDELVEKIAEYDALMVRSQTKVTAKIIEAGKNLKIIGRAGVGVDNIDIDAATQKGIIVVNSPDGNTTAAAEHTIALMLAMARNIAPAAASTKQGKWERSKFTGCELFGKTLGIIGLGKIGSHVAKVAKALGMNINVYDPFASKELVEKLGATYFENLDDFWGENEKSLGSLSKQIEGTMLVTLWAFIGIEGAVVMSKHAKSPKMVGRATLLGFSGCLAIYVLLSVLPFGLLGQEELSKLANPSTGAVLELVIGKWGAYIMNVGLLISVLTSWLAWTMVTAQIPEAAAVNGTFPKEFQRENDKKAPYVSLYVTSFLMQLFMLLVYFSNNAWNTMLSITSVMVLPAYFMSALYLWKLCEDHEYPSDFYIKRSSALISAIIGVFYAVWLIYAAGLNYLFMAIIFMTLGIPVFCYARKQSAPNEPVFLAGERFGAIILFLISLFAIYAMSKGIVNV